MSECTKLQKDLEQANLDKNEAMKELKAKESRVQDLTKQLGDTRLRAMQALHAKNFEKEKEEFSKTKQELEDKIRQLEDGTFLLHLKVFAELWDAKQSRRDLKQKEMKMEAAKKRHNEAIMKKNRDYMNSQQKLLQLQKQIEAKKSEESGSKIFFDAIFFIFDRMAAV